MTLQIVRISGASYSGSTALGYVLNTAEGYFFGSETYRLLDRFQERSKRMSGRYRRPQCDVCGPACQYWSKDLLTEIWSARLDSLAAIYAAFSRHNPEVAVYVDGSKDLRWYDKDLAGKNIVSMKHPLRMIASSVYNDRKVIGLLSNEFDNIKQEISIKKELALSYAEKYLMRLSKIYDALFRSLENCLICRADQMHENGFAGFHELSAYLNLDTKIHPTDFSGFPVHTLGGNRAPLWRVLERQTGREIDHPRKKYYDSAQAIGDWSLDNKYAILFTPEIQEALKGLEAYARACAVLGYHPDLPAPGP
jgi:hypothetical protein